VSTVEHYIGSAFICGGLYLGEKKTTAPKKAAAAAPAAKKGAAAVSAKKVAGALKKGSGRKATRVHTKVHFYKPVTLKLGRNPKVAVRSVPPRNKLDNYQILKFPLTTESAMSKIEDNNTLVFIVDVKANKRQIKSAVEAMHGVKVQRVNTLIR
jgi:large subunit ribosomal protein L23Ae